MDETNEKGSWGKEVFSLLSWFDMDRVKNANVLVVGAGALGNEVLKNLALFGVGNIVMLIMKSCSAPWWLNFYDGAAVGDGIIWKIIWKILPISGKRESCC